MDSVDRLIETMRRECLDYLIPLNDGHLGRILREWVSHYNEAAHNPAWYREFRSHRRHLRSERIATALRRRSGSCRRLFWADFTTNVFSSELRHSCGSDFCRRQVEFARGHPGTSQHGRTWKLIGVTVLVIIGAVLIARAPSKQLLESASHSIIADTDDVAKI
jgi:hypothetical protein